MNNCNLENKTLILTEGQLDSLSVTECGFENAVSVPTGMNGFTWVPHCWDWVHNFEKIIVFGDLDKIDCDKQIRIFIEKRGLKIIEFKGLDVIDYGGILPLN